MTTWNIKGKKVSFDIYLKTKKIAYAGLDLQIKKFNEIYFHLADLKA